MKRPKRKHLPTRRKIRYLGKPWDEKKLKPVQERIDAQRHFIAKENALNHQIQLDKMKSIGGHRSLMK